MVGAPASYSGNQPQAPATSGTNAMESKYAPPPPQLYSTPTPISTLLPYNGMHPTQGQAPPPHPPASAPAGPYPNPVQPLNSHYSYPTYNPPISTPFPVSTATPPTPFPPVSTATAPPPFPPFSTTAPQANPYSTSFQPPLPYPANPSNTTPAYPSNVSDPLSFPNYPVNPWPTPPPAHPSTGYTPQFSSLQPPGAYPPGQFLPQGNQTIQAPYSTSINPASQYPTQANPTSQPPYPTGTNSVPPPNTGHYPPPPAGGTYPPPQY